MKEALTFLQKIGAYLAVIIFCLPTACRKEPAPQPTTTITLTQPLPNAVIQNGDTLFIKGNITSDVSIHGYEVHLTSASGNDTLYNTTGHHHGNNVVIDAYWVNTLQADKTLTLTVKAVIDHADKQAEKTVPLYSKP